MNAKRQTIWLVSMLSLMVVLSAYYLFTEDVNKLDLSAVDAGQNPQEVKIDMSQTDQSAANPAAGKSSSAVTDQTSGKAVDKSSDKNPSAAGVKTDSKSTASSDKVNNQSAADTDAQVLQKMGDAQTTAASDYFTMEQMKNHEELKKKTEQLMTTITDPKQKPDVVAKADNDLQSLSGQQEQIDNLQEMLLKDYPQAVVSQEGRNWKVTVQSEKLEKSQGVTIVDLVMKELGAAPENIKIQYVRP
jgi:stage III sporulation protein AH